MKKLLYLILLILPTSLFLSGCSEESNTTTKESSSTEETKLSIYTTVYPLMYLTEQIGGDLVNVQTIYPPGADEHTFEPSQKDMINLADSDLFIYVGLGLEGFVEKAKNTLENENVTLLAAGENIYIEESHEEEHSEGDGHSEESHEEEHSEGDGHSEESHEEEHSEGDGHSEESHEEEHSEGDGHSEESHEEEHSEGDGHSEESHEEEHSEHDGHNHGDIDPHIWLDPLYTKELAEVIKAELIKQLPDHEDEFNTNFEKLAQELDHLHEEFEHTLHEAKHKEIIVAHAAYGYWEKRYGITQISVAGLSTSSEPSQKELEQIISTAKEHEIKYVFFEQNVSSKLTEIVQKEMNAEALSLHNLSVLTEQDIKEDRTYISIMQDNLKALETALNN
ncbi:metal ABC transporter solute-binding protein, Zn/Mn family [Cytobacillus sp. FJAT-54145]|uniref:Metal ABC transporter solute-binding protein, Zn/Mn family n=1 Tax=Cytobacillus spartinae TaxID=3299023 RepID=A0ABW6KGH3_9BACI